MSQPLDMILIFGKYHEHVASFKGRNRYFSKNFTKIVPKLDLYGYFQRQFYGTKLMC